MDGCSHAAGTRAESASWANAPRELQVPRTRDSREWIVDCRRAPRDRQAQMRAVPQPANDGSLIAFDDLFHALRRHGFTVGVDHYVRLYELLPHLAESCSPNDLKTILCPLFATAREE